MSQITGAAQPLAAAVAGLANAERASIREQAKNDPKIRDRFRRALDEAEISVQNTESAEAVRSTKGNDQEEGRQDRREHAAYGPGVQDGNANTPPRLDVEG